MLRKAGTQAYYKAARGGYSWCWCDQQSASMWTTQQGISGTIGQLRRYYRRRANEHMPKLEVVEYEIKEVGLVEKYL